MGNIEHSTLNPEPRTGEAGHATRHAAPVPISEKPMLFSAPMVRAILDGTKTQTRRVMKVQPASVEYWLYGKRSDRLNGLPTMRDATGKGWATCGPFKCPWIAEGMCALERGVLANRCDEDLTPRRSRLWVKETWAAWSSFSDEADEVEGTAQDLAERGITQAHIAYRADYQTYADRWRPSIFMPRWASRITLEIVSVRVERLQEISEADAKAEGCLLEDWRGENPQLNYSQWSGEGNPSPETYSYKNAYRRLWTSINGEGSWAANPWVWVIENRRELKLPI